MTVIRSTVTLVDDDGDRIEVTRNDTGNGDDLPFLLRLNSSRSLYVYATAADLIEFGRALAALGEAEQHRQTRAGR